MKTTSTPPNQFIKNIDDERRDHIKQLDKLIQDHMPSGTSRVMWEGKFWGGTDQQIIGYGDITFTKSDGSKVDWFVIGLANQKNYITVYINGYEDGMGLAKKYGAELGKVKTTTSAVNIKKLEDVNLDELGKLIKKAFSSAAE